MKLYAIRKQGKKENTSYIGLFADMGYKQIKITFEDTLIAQLLELSVKQLYEMPLDEKVYVK